DTDQGAVSDAQLVFLKAEKDAAMEEITREHGVPKAVPPVAPSALRVRVIETLQEMRHPAEFVLHGADMQARIALKDAGEDHMPEGHTHPMIGVGQEGWPGAAVVLEGQAGRRAVGGNVQAQGHVEILSCSPERLVLWTVVGGLLRRGAGSQCPAQPTGAA